jgi:hypothetical protein
LSAPAVCKAGAHSRHLIFVQLGYEQVALGTEMRGDGQRQISGAAANFSHRGTRGNAEFFDDPLGVVLMDGREQRLAAASNEQYGKGG